MFFPVSSLVVIIQPLVRCMGPPTSPLPPSSILRCLPTHVPSLPPVLPPVSRRHCRCRGSIWLSLFHDLIYKHVTLRQCLTRVLFGAPFFAGLFPGHCLLKITSARIRNHLLPSCLPSSIRSSVSGNNPPNIRLTNGTASRFLLTLMRRQALSP